MKASLITYLTLSGLHIGRAIVKMPPKYGNAPLFVNLVRSWRRKIDDLCANNYNYCALLSIYFPKDLYQLLKKSNSNPICLYVT